MVPAPGTIVWMTTPQRITRIAAVCYALVAVLGCTRGPGVGEVRPAGELQQQYGLYCNKAPQIQIDADNVPAHLHDLIPMAKRWGIGDDVIRGDCEDKATEAEKLEFKRTLTGRTAEVQAWLDSFPADYTSDETAAFLFMLVALEEMELFPD